MPEFAAEILEIIQRTPNVKSFRFKTEDDVTFKAGQYFLLTIKVDGEDKTKPFSFSNSPTEKGYIEFTKRITDSDFSSVLNGLKVGDKARIKMPYGSFTFEDEHEKIAFLSGGIGITPVRSMCKFAYDMGMSNHIMLLYGNNCAGDIVFKDDFDLMRDKDPNFHVIYILKQFEEDLKIQGCKIGFINDTMIKEVIPDFDERVFYICGPPEMVGCLTAILRDSLNLPDSRIRTEKFAGY